MSNVYWNPGDEYKRRINYNRPRENYLRSLFYGSPDEMKEFTEILGHDIDWVRYKNWPKKHRGYVAFFWAIREIAEREDWRVYDEDELLADPEYRKLAKIPLMALYSPTLNKKIRKYPEKRILSPEVAKEVETAIHNKIVHDNLRFCQVIFEIFLLILIMFMLQTWNDSIPLHNDTLTKSYVASFVCILYAIYALYAMLSIKKGYTVFETTKKLLLTIIHPLHALFKKLTKRTK